MILPEVLGKYLMDKVIGIIFIHFDLFQDHAFFAGDVLGIKDRVQHQVAQNINGDGHVLIQHLDVEADRFFSGKGVHVAADGVTWRAICWAERVVVPLNTMCSAKWDMPLTSGASSREPVFIQMPMEIERICDISSLSTINPLGRTSRYMFRASLSTGF